MPEDIPDLEEPPVEALPEQESQFHAPARFGHVPVERTPLGWDARKRGFRNHYPVVNLPTQIVDHVSFGTPDLEKNRLIWGDNLHVMRQLPSESVDLIYIDPPFFSNRVYNVIWGDDNEERSFSDIWEGGLDGYLIWLNARLYEMKRILKATGSIYVHCDWHASHYIKVEMDKIFGYENLRNEISWLRKQGERHNLARLKMTSAHDTILWYVKSNTASYNVQYVPYSQEYIERNYKFEDDNGRYATFPCTNDSGGNRPYEFRGITRAWRFSLARMTEMYENGLLTQATPTSPFRYKKYLDQDAGVKLEDIWVDIPQSRGVEKVGYPTQKPETLLERIIKASSSEGDLVLDAFVGGGTTPAVAQQLGRRWIAMDQSRVAVSVTAERLKAAVAERGLGDGPVPDFTVEHWGVYEAEKLSAMPPEPFRDFVLACYDARIPSNEQAIHGYKGARARVPVWVGSPGLTARVTAAEVNEFAQAIGGLDRYRGEEALRDGVMLAWGFAPDAVRVAEELREREALNLSFVRLEQVRIDSPSFRSHIASQSTERGDYSEFLTFVQPPDVEFGYRRLKPRHYEFDAGDTEVLNVGAKIINVQWDFDYDGHTFRAARREWFRRGKGRNPAPILDTQHTFSRSGRFTVACRVQDDKGGEGMHTAEVDVS